jgi:hypothetical protein
MADPTSIGVDKFCFGSQLIPGPDLKVESSRESLVYLLLDQIPLDFITPRTMSLTALFMLLSKYKSFLPLSVLSEAAIMICSIGTNSG